MGPYQHEVEAIAGGKYEVLRELGRGGMGVVYLALDTALQREVAVKVMRASFVAEPQYVERFRREAQVVARLTHPNVVHINALEMRDERLLIEMPYLRGGSLRERMERGMTTIRFVRVMHDALKALACCHAEGIIHRDVKPSNFLFDSEGVAKLSDFGAATLAEGEWEADMRHSRSSVIFIGTPQYACPEAWTGQDPTPGWDLYSLGMIAREACLGELPAAPTPLSFLNGILTEPLPPISASGASISADFALLIDNLTARHGEARLSDAHEALNRLRELPEFHQAATHQEDTILMLSSATPRKRTTRRIPVATAKRSAGVAGLVLGVCLILAAAFILGARSIRSEVPESTPAAGRVATQRAAFVERAPSAEELLGLLRGPSADRTRLYDWTSASDPRANGQMILRRGTGDRPHHVIGSFEGRLLGLTLAAQADGGYRADGWWGAYIDTAGRGPRFGWASGIASEPSGPGGALWFDLALSSETDIERWVEKFFAVPAPTGTDTAFLHGIERSPVLMPLLFNEILPRDVEKQIHLSGMLPAVDAAITAVRTFEAGALPQIDGRLDEWGELSPGLDGRPQRNGPRLAAAHSEDALYLAFTVENTAGVTSRLDVALLPLYHLPSHASPYLLFHGTEEQQEFLWIEGGSALPLLGDFQFSGRVDSGRWSAELRLPYASMPGIGQVGRDTVMRINAALFDTGDSAAPALAAWGWPEIEAVQHGALLFYNVARAQGES